MNKIKITEDDYQFCLQALDDVRERKPSIVRIRAATFYGGRARWQAIVDLWEAGQKKLAVK